MNTRNLINNTLEQACQTHGLAYFFTAHSSLDKIY